MGVSAVFYHIDNFSGFQAPSIGLFALDAVKRRRYNNE